MHFFLGALRVRFKISLKLTQWEINIIAKCNLDKDFSLEFDEISHGKVIISRMRYSLMIRKYQTRI